MNIVTLLDMAASGKLGRGQLAELLGRHPGALVVSDAEPPAIGPVITTRAWDELCARPAAEVAPWEDDQDATAILLYTSGTTCSAMSTRAGGSSTWNCSPRRLARVGQDRTGNPRPARPDHARPPDRAPDQHRPHPHARLRRRGRPHPHPPRLRRGEDAGPIPVPAGWVQPGGAAVAFEMRDSYLGLEHAFLSMLRNRDTVPARALAGLADLDALEVAVLAAKNAPASGPPENAVFLPDGQEFDSSLRRAIIDALPENTTFGFSTDDDLRTWISVITAEGVADPALAREVLNTALATLTRPDPKPHPQHTPPPRSN